MTPEEQERAAVVAGDATWVAFILWSSKIERDVLLHDLTDEEISDLLEMINLADAIEKGAHHDTD